MIFASTARLRGPTAGNLLKTMLRTTVSAGACIAAFQGVAYAQTADNSTVGLNEIIVTAQKREQSIQDVPIAVTALGQEAIQVNRIENASALTGLAPGMVARQTAGGMAALSFAMRGVNANPSAPLQDKQISMYIDGVYIGGSRGTMSELMEVERIEVLRGPQGTLFGRNSTSGAVNIVTRNPTGEMAFRQDVTMGNQDQLRTRTTIDTPAFGPFSAYATYIHDESRGDVRNLGAGTTWNRTNPFTDVGVQTSPKWLGGRNYENVFAALRFDNGGSFKATYKFDWSNGNFVADARVTPVINTVGNRISLNGTKTTVGGPNFLGAMLAGIIAAQPAGGGKFGPITLNPSDRRPDAANQAWATEGYHHVKGHSLTMEWQASDNLSFKNVMAYRKLDVWSGGSSVAGLSGLEFTTGAVAAYAPFVAASTVPGFATMPAATQGAIIGQISQGLSQAVGLYFAPYEGASGGQHRQFSEELQANYTNDWLQLTAGLLYYNAKTTDSGLPGFRPNFAFAPFPQTLPLGGLVQGTGWTKSYAGYAQAEISATDKLGIVLGGRLTKDDKHGTFTSGGTLQGDRYTGTIVGAKVLAADFKKSKPTYSVGVNYKPNDDLLVYAKYATGFLSGGSYGDIEFKPEIAKSWEAGFKADLLDRRVRLNIAAYNVEYNNAQAATSGTAVGRTDLNIAVVQNGKLKAKGVELDLTLAPFEGFTMGGTVGYTKNKLVNPDPRLADGYTIKPTGQPKFVGTANAQYVTRPLFGDATLLLRADMTFQSKSRVLNSHQSVIDFPVFAPFEFIPSKQIVNTRVALRDVSIGGTNVEFGLWSKNLFDNKKPLYPFQYPYFLMTTTYEPARKYGVDVIIKFKP